MNQADNSLAEVTQIEFFAALREDRRDVMPVVLGKYPYRSEWRTTDASRVLVGVSAENRYWLSR